MARWIVESIPPLPERLDIAVPPEAHLPLQPRPQVTALRQVFYVRAAQDGSVDENAWQGFEVDRVCSSVEDLRDVLRTRMGSMDIHFSLTTCVRAGRYGRLVPLVAANLPTNMIPLYIVLLPRDSPADAALRFPDIGA